MDSLKNAIYAGFTAALEANAEDATPFIEEKVKLWIAQELIEKYPTATGAEYEAGYQAAMEAIGCEVVDTEGSNEGE